jgi:hypothetical protein
MFPTVKQGKTWVQPVTWLDEEGDPVNIAGCVFRVQLRTDYADTEIPAGIDPILDLTTGAGISIDAGDIVMRAEAEATALIPPGTYLIEMEVVLANLDTDQVFLDRIVVEAEVVR